MRLDIGKPSGWVALALASAVFLLVPASAQDKLANSSAGKPATGVRKNGLKAEGKRKSASRSRNRSRRASYRYRLSQLKLEPQRVREIQQALIRVGYLSQEPTGKWDDQTREAMRRYQADHGFPTTGLPEAKSLMKLGLGPHPLPEDCDPTAQVSASSSTFGQPGAPESRPGSASSSPQQD